MYKMKSRLQDFKRNAMQQKTNDLTSEETEGIAVIEQVFN